jgi:hypothetical protein
MALSIRRRKFTLALVHANAYVALPSFFWFSWVSDLNSNDCTAHAKRPKRSFELVGAVVLFARNKSECTAGRLHNNLARRTRRIVNELVEQDL